MRKKNYNSYRRMRITAEKRANQDCEYVRPARRPHNLIDPWDDKPICITKSWKDKRKTQYRPDGRGSKHTITLSADYYLIFLLERYFKDNDIPFRIEEKRKVVIKTYTSTSKPIKAYDIPRYTYGSNRHQIGYESVYKDVKLEKPVTYTRKSYERLGYEVTWWSKKDIGIYQVLESFGV